MSEQNEPEQEWRPRRSFANTDPRAVTLAELLHEARSPQLTILFGSRARGDYGEGRSDVDIMLVEDQQPDDGTVRNAAMAFRKAKAELYRGQDISSDWIVLTPAEFIKRSRGVNRVEAGALNDGYILGADAEYYRALGRRRETSNHTRWANRHLEYLDCLKEAEDDSQGAQAYLAVTHALKAVVNAAGEWCPQTHDVEMLLELARKADPKGQYATTLDPEIYTQYGRARDGLPPHTPFTSRPEHRGKAADDILALLARTETLKEAWPPPTERKAAHADYRPVAASKIPERQAGTS